MIIHTLIQSFITLCCPRSMDKQRLLFPVVAKSHQQLCIWGGRLVPWRGYASITMQARMGGWGEVAHQWHRGGQLLTCANDCERQSPSQQALKIVVLCSQIRPYTPPPQKKLVQPGQRKKHDITQYLYCPLHPVLNKIRNDIFAIFSMSHIACVLSDDNDVCYPGNGPYQPYVCYLHTTK